MKIQGVCWALCSALLFTACGGGGKTETEEATEAEVYLEEEAAVEESTTFTVCLWDELSVREEPKVKGKYITALSLGEQVTDLEEVQTDASSANQRQFRKVRLSDGTEGWVRHDLVYTVQELVVPIANATLYKRPDLLTATKEQFYPMDMLAVLESNGDWLKVTGIPRGDTWFSEGWIKDASLYRNEETTRTAVYVKKAQAAKETSKMMEYLSQALANESTYAVKEVVADMITEMPVFADAAVSDLYSCWFTSTQEYDFKREEDDVKVSLGDQTYGGYIDYDYAASYAAYLLRSCMASAEGLQASADDYYTEEVLASAFERYSGYELSTEGGAAYGITKVNTEAINWAMLHMIPDPKASLQGTSYQEIYDVVFQETVRAYAAAYMTSLHYSNLEEVYIYELDNNPDFDVFSFFYDHVTEQPDRVGWWARRSIEGSGKEVWNLIRKVLLNYDKSWYETRWSLTEEQKGMIEIEYISYGEYGGDYEEEYYEEEYAYYESRDELISYLQQVVDADYSLDCAGQASIYLEMDTTYLADYPNHPVIEVSDNQGEHTLVIKAIEIAGGGISIYLSDATNVEDSRACTLILN